MDKFFLPSETIKDILEIQKNFAPAIQLAKETAWMRDINKWAFDIAPILKDNRALIDGIRLNKEWQDTYKAIYEHNKDIFIAFGNIQQQFKEMEIAKSIVSLHSSFHVAINNITEDPVFQKDEWLMNTLKNTTAKVSAATAVIKEKEIITNEDLEKLNEKVDLIKTELLTAVDNISRSKKAQIDWFISRFSFLVLMFQLLLPLIHKQQTEKGASFDQVEAIRKDVHQLMITSIRSKTDTCYLRISAGLYYKPSTRSRRMLKVNQETEVYILDTYHKWAQVIVIDKDGLPVSGWVMKKYLETEKK